MISVALRAFHTVRCRQESTYLYQILSVNVNIGKGGRQDLKESAISELRPTGDETIDIVGCNL